MRSCLACKRIKILLLGMVENISTYITAIILQEIATAHAKGFNVIHDQTHWTRLLYCIPQYLQTGCQELRVC